MSVFPRLDILPRAQRVLWPRLADVSHHSVMKVASLDDLLANKLKTLLQRVEPKDYIDVDALLQSGLNLARGLAGARLLFPSFAPQECLKALTYFDDDALRDLPRSLEQRLLSAVRDVQTLPGVRVDSTSLSD